MANLNYNVNAFKNTTIKAQAGETYNITFIGDILNQVQYSASKDDIIITAYQIRNGIPTSKPIGKLTLKNAITAQGVNLTIFAHNEGLNLFNEVFPAVYKGNKYTGSSFSEAVSSNEKNETFSLGKGNDSINYNFNTTENHGKDIVNLTKGGHLALNFTDNNVLGSNYIYRKQGNDAVIEVRENINFTYNAKIVCSVSKGTTYGYYTVSAKMYQVDETNYEVSKKAYPIVFYTQNVNAMELTPGKTTALYCQLYSSVETVYEQFQELLRQEAQFYTGDYVAYSTTKNPADNVATITLKNYFTIQDIEAVSVNKGDFTAEITEVLNTSYQATAEDKASLKKRNIKDTFLSETFDIGWGKGDTLSSLSGNDTITINSPNNPNIISQNNLTLKNGLKTLNFEGNFGNTKITTDNTATLNFSGTKGELIKNGNNLEIYQDYYNNNIDKITINNYFKNPDNYCIKFDGSDNLTTALRNGDKRILYDYSNKKDKKVTGSELSDYIICGINTKTVNAGGGNNLIKFDTSLETLSWAESTSGTGDDTFLVHKHGVSHDFSDKGGADAIIFQDENYLYEADDFLFIFDVLKNGAKAPKKNYLDYLHVIYKANYDPQGSSDITLGEIAGRIAQNGELLSTLNVENFFNKQNNNQQGIGFIEKFGYDDNGNYTNWNMNIAKFNAVREQVANWLDGHNGYSCASQVLDSGKQNDIAELLQIYSGINNAV